MDVPKAMTCRGVDGSSALIASSASNWSRNALPSAHHEPAGSYEEPTSAYPRSSRACLVDGSGASAASSGPKPWL
jgi:hypothetical protein